MSPVRYELGFYMPEDGIFIVTVVNTTKILRQFVACGVVPQSSTLLLACNA
jgi:hypothetical protein